MYFIGDESYYGVDNAMRQNLDKFSIDGGRIYGVWADISDDKTVTEELRASIRRVATNKSVVSLGVLCFPTMTTKSWEKQLKNLLKDVGTPIPVTLLNYLPKDASIHSIRENNETRHQEIASFKSLVASNAYLNAFALLEPYLPDIFGGLSDDAKNKTMAQKFKKIGGIVINAFKSKITTGPKSHISGSNLINPALLPDSPPKTASNNCPVGNGVQFSNKPDPQLAGYLENLTAVMTTNSQLMNQIAANNLQQQQQQQPNHSMPPLPVPNQDLLRSMRC